MSSRFISLFSHVSVSGLLFLLVACATAPSPTPTALSPTLAPVTPTSSAPRAVTFATRDGVTLAGTLYGQGETAIIFSNMGDKHPDSWAAMAQAAADAGYLALTYDFRYWVNGKMDLTLARHVGNDLSAAVDFVRGQGARQVVLVGASLGGMASAKVAAQTQAVAVVIIGSPLNAPSVHLQVEETELQAIHAPKLFITSENDQTVEAAALKEMYTLALDPKELEVYPGTAHGTDIFKTDHGAALRERILTFITTHAPAR